MLTLSFERRHQILVCFDQAQPKICMFQVFNQSRYNLTVLEQIRVCFDFQTTYELFFLKKNILNDAFWGTPFVPFC